MTTEPQVQESEEKGTVWVMLTCVREIESSVTSWVEREPRITAGTRREAEKEALTIAPDESIVTVVPLTSWKPVTAERPKDFRIVAADPWLI